jgi:GMP reductase
MRILETRSIYYDDVNLIAQPQEYISSRKQIYVDPRRILVAPMPSVVGEKFCIEASRLGLFVCLHRFKGIDYQIDILNNAGGNLTCSVGLKNTKEDVKKLYDAGFEEILIDVANGYLKDIQYFINNVIGNDTFDNIIVGNIHSSNGYAYIKSGIVNRSLNVKYRVGIGSGSVCETASKATGYGRGQITEIMELSNYSESIIADGGIRDAGCAAKAFGAGAGYVMMGGYFAMAEEAENVINGEYKHWGCASDYNQTKFGEKTRHAEGKVIDIDKRKILPLAELWYNLEGGLQSAISYSGEFKHSDFIGNGVFEIKK